MTFIIIIYYEMDKNMKMDESVNTSRTGVVTKLK